jgi:hypothetical protein
MIDMGTLLEQVSESTATSEDGDHLVQMYYPQFIHSEGKIRTLQQASNYLDTGEWVSVVATCTVQECCLPSHLDEAANLLVAQHSQAVSLADLYKKGRSRGLLTAQSTGYGG